MILGISHPGQQQTFKGNTGLHLKVQETKTQEYDISQVPTRKLKQLSVFIIENLMQNTGYTGGIIAEKPKKGTVRQPIIGLATAGSHYHPRLGRHRGVQDAEVTWQKMASQWSCPGEARTTEEMQLMTERRGNNALFSLPSSRSVSRQCLLNQARKQMWQPKKQTRGSPLARENRKEQ